MKNLILFVFLCPFFNSQAQTWTQQTTSTTASFGSIKFPNDSVGYCVGGTTLLKTVDRGLNWTTMPPITTTTGVFNLAFEDQDTGWATSNSGAVFKTVDGGMNWSSVSTGVSSSAGVYFVNSTIGWAVAFNGGIITTADGGASWTPQTSGVNTHLINLYFVSANIGWAVGFGGVILKTVNGGQNWTAQTSGTTEDLYGIYFTDASTGWICGWNGTIKKTTDGGISWLTQPSNSTIWLTDVHFTSANEGWITGQGGKIYHTTDGGATWTDLTLNTAGAVLMSTDFIDSHQGWVCSNNGRIFRYCQLITQQPADFTSTESGSATFTITPAYTSSTYQWQKQSGSAFINLSNGVQYNGVNTSTLDISSLTAADNNTNYRCVVNSAGCSDTSAIRLLTVNNTAGFDNMNASNSSFVIFPNPSEESVFIQYNLPNSGASATISITSTAGKLVKQLSVEKLSGKIELNSSDFEKGIYIISIIMENGTIKTEKWINAL